MICRIIIMNIIIINLSTIDLVESIIIIIKPITVKVTTRGIKENYLIIFIHIASILKKVE